MPKDSTRSRNLVRPSTDHASSNFAEGRLLQMLLTPSAAKTRSDSLVDWFCVPSFIRPAGAGSARAEVWVLEMAREAAVSLVKVRRFILASDCRSYHIDEDFSVKTPFDRYRRSSFTQLLWAARAMGIENDCRARNRRRDYRSERDIRRRCAPCGARSGAAANRGTRSVS